MELSKSFTRRDRGIQLIRQESKPLTLFNRIKCKNDDINDLEEVIDVDRDLEIYQKNIEKFKTTTAISYGNI